MRRVSYTAYEAVFGVVYLGLMTNLLLLVGCLPTVVLLVMTDPASSWPLLAVTVPWCAPALVAAFAVFREHAQGGSGVVRAYVAGWRSGWRRSLTLGVLLTVVVAVLLVDVRVLGESEVGTLFIPLLGVLTVLALGIGLVGLVAIAEEPRARLRDVLRASTYLSLRRWYLTAVSLAVLAVQGAFLAASPALAIGLSAAPLLYVAWANSRFTLRPVLAEAGDVVGGQAVPA